MATSVRVEFTDDLDPAITDDVQTVTFGIDGQGYEIDLGPGNRRGLEEALPVKHARRLGPPRRRRAATHHSSGGPAASKAVIKERNQQIKDWACTQRWKPGDFHERGRLPTDVITGFYEANPDVVPLPSHQSVIDVHRRRPGGRRPVPLASVTSLPGVAGRQAATTQQPDPAPAGQATGEPAAAARPPSGVELRVAKARRIHEWMASTSKTDRIPEFDRREINSFFPTKTVMAKLAEWIAAHPRRAAAWGFSLDDGNVQIELADAATG